MAKANVHGFLNKLEDICECSICYNEYDDEGRIPRVLPCQHTFCTNCLSKQCGHQKLKCPLCNQEFHVKNKKVNRFPKDYTRRELKELLDKFTKSLCKECNNLVQVQYFCKTCNARLCYICYSQRKMGQCRTHVIEKHDTKPISQELLNHTTDTPSDSICFRADHEMNQLKYFCVDKSCFMPVCSNCIVETHKNHEIKSAVVEYNERKEVMINCCQATKDIIANAKTFLNTIIETKTELNDQINEIEKVERQTNVNVETKKIAQETFQKYIKMLKRKEEEVVNFIENASECCAISEEAISGKNVISLLSVQMTLTTKLKSFEQLGVDTCKPLDPMPQASDFNLLTSPLEHEGDKDRVTGKNVGITGKLSCLKEIWKCLLLGRITPTIPDLFWSVFKVFFFGLFLGIGILLRLCPVPYSRVFNIDHTDLALRKSHSAGSLICYSTDSRRFSNVPLQDIRQTCGNKDKPYVFRGAFSKNFLRYKNGKHMDFKINVSRIKKYVPGVILFEFGVSTGAIERRDIFRSRSSDFFGWTLTIVTSEREVALINTEGQIVHSGIISVFDEASYVFCIEDQSNKTIVLKAKDDNKQSYKILDKTDSIRGNPEWGFAKICHSHNAHVTVKLLSSYFHRSTLYPNLFIAVDNRTISNVPQSSFRSKFIQRNKKEHDFHDIMLLDCDTKCVYVLNFRVEAPTVNDVFTLILTNSQFLPSAHYNISLFTYTRCPDTNVPTQGSFCFLVYRNDAAYSYIPMTPNTWHSISIVVYRKQNYVSFMFGKYVMDIADINILGQGTPILRSVLLTLDVPVEIRLGESDDLDILTWFIYEFTNYYILKNAESNQQTVSADTENNLENFQTIQINEPYRKLGTTRR